MLKVGTAEDVIAEATDVMKVEGDLTLQPHTRRGSLAGGAASTEAEGLTVTCRVRSGEARSRGRVGREGHVKDITEGVGGIPYFPPFTECGRIRNKCNVG